jgi:hypothetical protein
MYMDPGQARDTWYNIVWWNLLVTCSRSGFPHQKTYRHGIAEILLKVALKYNNPHPMYMVYWEIKIYMKSKQKQNTDKSVNYVK